MISEARKNYIKLWRFEHAEQVKSVNKAWSKRNPDKVNKSRKSWLSRNIFIVLERRRKWRAENIDKVMSHDLKYLSKHPERSLFPTFVDLDDKPGWEDNFLDNGLDPSQILIMKEQCQGIGKRS